MPMRNRWIVPLLLLIASLVVFWLLPAQLRDGPVKVEFSDPD